jgi:hypothetical protein
MGRANVIILVLMGGGLTLWAARPSAECQAARDRGEAMADTICHRSGFWYGHSSGYGYGGGGSGFGNPGGYGRSVSAGASSIASVVRGGFGGFHGSQGS